MTLTIQRDGPVTTLIQDRREARNAMDPASAEALTEALLAFDRDESQFVAVLWGAGGAFCAGFDLKYAGSLLGQKEPLAQLDFPAGEGTVPRGPMSDTPTGRPLRAPRPAGRAATGKPVRFQANVSRMCGSGVGSSGA